MDAENNVIKAIGCINGYNTGMDRDNQTLETYFRAEYPKYC